MVHCSKCGAQNAEGARYCSNCATALALTPQAASQGPQPQQAQPQAPDQPQFPPGHKATLLDYLSHYQGLQTHWAKRFVAIVLDAIFVVVPVYVAMVLMSWLVGNLLFVGVGGVVLFLYSALLESTSGATLGKAILGLKVVSIQGKLELPNTMIRNITKIYPLLLILEFIVSLVVETTDAHQRFTDKLAKTTVIEKA